MTEAGIAKNILLNHVCDNCKHQDNEYFLECGIRKNFPEERTCEKWELFIIPELGYTISTTQVKTKARKLKVKWTKETLVEMQSYGKLDEE